MAEKSSNNAVVVPIKCHYHYFGPHVHESEENVIEYHSHNVRHYSKTGLCAGVEHPKAHENSVGDSVLMPVIAGELRGLRDLR